MAPHLLQPVWILLLLIVLYVIVGHIKGRHLRALYPIWVEIRTEANIADVRMHDLRHSFASVVLDKTGSLPLIGKLLGHKSINTTARYAHIAASPAEAAAETAGALISELWDLDARMPIVPLRPVRRRTLRQFLDQHQRLRSGALADKPKKATA